MANKKVSQLTSKPSVLNTDIVPIADPSTGQLFKTTLSALGAVIGSAVASVNGLVGVVVLDTDDIQELASPTNRWYTDTRSRAALSGGTGISYNSGTGVITSSVTLADLGGVPTSRTLTINGTAFDLSANRSWSIDSMVYPGAGIPISTGSAWGTSIANNSGNWNTAFSWGNHAGLYLPIGGGTLTGALNGTTASFSGTISANHSTSANYGAFFYNGSTTGDGLAIRGGSTSSQNALLVQNYNGSSTLFNVLANGESAFSGNVTANSFVKTGGLSTWFLKADGSVDSRTFATTGNLGDYLPLTGGALLNNPSSAYVLTITNNSTASGANGLNVSIATGSTGMPFKVDKGGVSLFTVDNLGASVLKSTITAISFIKSSGTSSEFLKADGSVDNNTYVSSSALSAYLPLSGGTLTGALGGTSATFTGALNGTSATFTGALGGTSATFTGLLSSLNTGAGNVGAVIGNSSAGGFGVKIRGGSDSSTYALTVNSADDNSIFFRVRGDGNVGIGTTAPNSILEISSTTPVFRIHASNADTFHGIEFRQGAGFDAFIKQHPNSGEFRISNGRSVGWGGYMTFYTDTVERLQIASTGAATFSSTVSATSGTTGAKITLGGFTNYGVIQDVNSVNRIWFENTGSFRTIFDLPSAGTSFVFRDSSGNIGASITSAGAATFSSSVTATGFFESSDKNLKNLIEDNYQAKGIESITAKLYTKNGVTELGYYAQDVQSILPSAVTTGADGFLNLSYREVHTAKIARLEKRVQELEEQLNLI